MCVRKIPNLRLCVTHGSLPIIFFPGTPAVFAKFAASVLSHLILSDVMQLTG